MEKQVWYVKNGSDPDLIKSAILTARVTGSVGASEIHMDGLSDRIEKFATVRREGHQENNYYKLEG